MDGGNLEALDLLWKIAAFVISGGVGLYAYLANRHRADEKDLQQLAARVTAIEATIRDLPSQRDLGDIARQIEAVGGDVRALAASVSGVKELLPAVQNSVTLITEHLLKGVAPK